jgi:NADH:ubiquinone oxidoreductase subunit K
MVVSKTTDVGASPALLVVFFFSYMLNIVYWDPIVWSVPFLYNTFFFSEILLIFQMCLLGYIVFFFGIIGLIIRRISIIYILIAIELMFLGLDIVFLFIGFLLYLPFLQLVVLILLVLAACEAAIILSVVYNYYRLVNTTDIFLLRLLRY